MEILRNVWVKMFSMILKWFKSREVKKKDLNLSKLNKIMLVIVSLVSLFFIVLKK